VRFQQTTGPIMAKALEDTAFYRYNRLIALNEVGGEPDRFGAPLEDFHAAMAQRLRHQPAGLSATSTHDTKRGEDSRARLYVLSEMPEAWAAAVHRWTVLNAEFRRVVDDLTMPEPEVEWMFYQALAGAWPADLACDDADGLAALAERMAEFMLKAVREAKAHTSWTAQDADYEAAVERFTRDALDPAKGAAFLQNFAAMCGPAFLAGALNSLSQTAIKLTAPGVPDIYQGSELWELSLVDPDNRRAVDYDTCRSLQASVGGAAPEALLADWRSAGIKMRLLHAVLALRARAQDLFAGGDYVPLTVEGDAAENVLAFARVTGTQAVITIVPRMTLGLLSGESTPLVPAERWGDTAVTLPAQLAGQSWHDVVTGEALAGQGSLPVGVVLGRFPVAVLVNEALQERS
jgi:(1->4)-alpha-D-glucan 1-alpha-D-glucosylmutase